MPLNRRRAATLLAGAAANLVIDHRAAAKGVITKAPVARSSKITIETITRGLNHPWGLQYLPDGRMLVTERVGTMRLVSPDGRLSKPIANLPQVWLNGQGGLLDVALAPDFDRTGQIAFAYAYLSGAGNGGTAVATARLALNADDGSLERVTKIFTQEPAAPGGQHFGCRLVFARDRTLFIALGDRGRKDDAQDLGSHIGKVLRINIDGSVPHDNPFVGAQRQRPEIWSYGHRNIQGANLHPGTGELWTVEHGPRGGDEINIPKRAKNYGWPAIGYGIDYSGAPLHSAQARDGMEQPIYYWRPSIAPSGMAFYSSNRVPDWQGNVFVGALAGQALHRLILEGDQVVGEEVLLKDRVGRIRDVRAAPDGTLTILTDDPNGGLFRLSGHNN